MHLTVVKYIKILSLQIKDLIEFCAFMTRASKSLKPHFMIKIICQTHDIYECLVYGVRNISAGS